MSILKVLQVILALVFGGSVCVLLLAMGSFSYFAFAGDLLKHDTVIMAVFVSMIWIILSGVGLGVVTMMIMEAKKQ